MQSPNYVQFKHHGIVTDLPPEEVSPDNWTSGSNVVFQEGTTKRSDGYNNYAQPLLGAGPIFALQVKSDADLYWIYCTNDKVFVTNGQNHWDITPAGGLVSCNDGDWTGCILNGVPVLNNSQNRPFYWNLDPLTTCAYLPGWPQTARCKAMRAFKYHLFALNITDAGNPQPDTLWWSSGAEPGTIPQEWEPAPDNDAGDMVLSDTASGIVDGLSLRDNFIVYKNYSTYALSYVAGQFVYTQRKLFLTTGVQSRNCITELNGEHWLFTGTDVIKHDGQNFQSVIQNKVKNQITDLIEPSRLELPVVTARIRDKQVWVAIPTFGNAWLNKAYVINTITGDVGVRELPQVAYIARGVVIPVDPNVDWDNDPQSWEEDITMWDQPTFSSTEDTLLLCDQDNNALLAVGYTDLANGQQVTAYAERLSLPTNDNILRAFVTKVIPRIEGQVGEVVNISVGGQSFFSSPINWSTPQPFVIGQTVGIDVQVEGRLISIKFEATTEKVWKLHSYKLEIVDLGLF